MQAEVGEGGLPRADAGEGARGSPPRPAAASPPLWIPGPRSAPMLLGALRVPVSHRVGGEGLVSCSRAPLAALAGSRERFSGVCPSCGWEVLCAYTVGLDGRCGVTIADGQKTSLRGVGRGGLMPLDLLLACYRKSLRPESCYVGAHYQQQGLG